MKKIICNFVIAIALLIFLSYNVHDVQAQGNFTTEWDSPAGWIYTSMANLDVSSNKYDIIFYGQMNYDSLRIYDGTTFNLKYAINVLSHYNLHTVGSYSNGIGVTKFDVNGDGVNEIIVDNGSGIGGMRILNPVNGEILFQSNFQYLYLLDLDDDGFVELITKDPGDHHLRVISTPAQTVSVINLAENVKNYDLKQNYPNPFNPNTTIEYNLNRTSEVKVIIYDILGKEVSKLVNEKQQTGKYKINVNASGLSSGTYFYSLIVDGLAETKKMILIK